MTEQDNEAIEQDVIATPAGINWELVKNLQQITALAQQGKILAFAGAAFQPGGSVAQVAVVADEFIPGLNTGLDCLKKKMIDRLTQLETRGAISSIIRPPGRALS